MDATVKPDCGICENAPAKGACPACGRGPSDSDVGPYADLLAWMSANAPYAHAMALKAALHRKRREEQGDYRVSLPLQCARHLRGLLEAEREKTAQLLNIVGEARELIAGDRVGVDWKRACASFVTTADAAIAKASPLPPMGTESGGRS